jgi:CRISPR/Cas system CSM-associated protein Csm3 (group 7 of RAMP superfamily)
MARDVGAVWVIGARLVARTPLHVGGGGEDATADLALARDGQGHLHVPGTTLAGVLREQLRRAGGDTDGVFGFQSGQRGHASYVRVRDARVVGEGIEVRDATSIDRRSGAAADRFLHSRQVVPVGSEIPLELIVEVPRTGLCREIEGGARKLAGLLTAKQATLTLGAAGSRGLGRMEVVPGSLAIHRLDLDRLAHLAAWWQLRAGRALPLPADAAQDVTPVFLPHQWRVAVHWRPEGPLLVRAGARGVDIDLLPLVGWQDGAWYPVLPGASVKGALRSRAERIVRTLGGVRADDPRSLLGQIDLDRVGSVGVALGDLFGRARVRGQRGPARSALFVSDCVHREPCPAHPTAWELQGWDALHKRTRIAVDRWTGGAQDSALFTALEPPWEPRPGGEARWNPLELRLDLSLLDGERGDLAMALFWLVLRDLCGGLVAFGSGTRAGMGRIAVDRVEISHGGDEHKLSPDLQKAGAVIPEFPRWQESWRKACGR